MRLVKLFFPGDLHSAATKIIVFQVYTPLFFTCLTAEIRRAQSPRSLPYLYMTLVYLSLGSAGQTFFKLEHCVLDQIYRFTQRGCIEGKLCPSRSKQLREGNRRAQG